MMVKNRNLLFTFDFELFLGENSGTVENCLKKPTDELLHVFEEFKITKAIFFVDTTYLSALKRHAGDKKIVAQFKEVEHIIKRILASGNYVFPHIHPHWRDAVLMDNKRWNLSNVTKYRFENCSSQEREAVWNDSIGILKEIGVENYHPIDSFRAGGWSIQPFENFASFFSKDSIKYDFTVLPGAMADTNAQKFDFRNATPKPYYRFSNNPVIEDSSGAFIEFPISAQSTESRNEFFYRIFKKYLQKTGVKSFGDGLGVRAVNHEPLIKSDYKEMISLELLNWYTYNSYVKFVKENETVQFISHPKMLSGHNLKYFRKLLKEISRQYSLQFDFRTLIEE